MTEIWQAISNFLEFELYSTEAHEVTVGHLFLGAAVLVLSFLVSRVTRRIIRRAAHARGISEEGTVGTAQSLSHFLILAIGAVVAVQAMGFNLTSLLAAGTIVAVAVGFALQSIMQNFVSGIILLTERTIKPSDILEVESTVVRVEEVGLRSTIARTRDDEQLIIPNSVLVQSTVTNYTLRDTLFRVRSQVGVSYSSDMQAVADTLLEVGMNIPGRTQLRNPVVFLAGFGNSSVDFELSIWIEDPWEARVTRSDLNFRMWRALQETGVTIAFPQLDLHVKAFPGSESVEPPTLLEKSPPQEG